jgi:exodeoxyribonuclease X
MISTVVVIDTETTGVDHEKDKVVEIGAVRVEYKKKGSKVRDVFSTLVNPLMPMPPYSRAVHHISNRDVKDAPLFPDALDMLRTFVGKGKFLAAAHSAAFDSGFFPKKSPWICTWRCARHLFPDLESHSNQALRYALPDVNEWIEEAGPELAMPPHRALPDAWVTAHVVRKMLETKTPEELQELTEAPILMKTIRFGMHRGTKFEELPASYLSWMCRQPDMDPDAKHTADHWLRNK